MSRKKILFLAANPTQTTYLRLHQELDQIKKALKRSKLRDQFEIESRETLNSETLRQALLDEKPDIVHFSGHGTGADGLVIEGQGGQPKPATSKALSGLFKLLKNININIECVLLNACYAEVQAQAIVESVDYVIGMRQAIRDNAAIAFAVGFYDGLGYGLPIKNCFDLGVNAIQFEVAKFSSTSRGLVIPTINSSSHQNQVNNLPDDSIPILLRRKGLVDPRPNFPVGEENSVGKENYENLVKFQDRVKEFQKDSKLSTIEKFQLYLYARVLGISEEKVNDILDVEIPHEKPIKPSKKTTLIVSVLIACLSAVAAAAVFSTQYKCRIINCPVQQILREEKTEEDQKLDIKISDFLKNQDIKESSEKLKIEKEEDKRSDKNGEVSIEEKSIIYTPANNYYGNDSFKLKILKNEKHRYTIVINIIVDEVNDPPEAKNDFLNYIPCEEDDICKIEISKVLKNDTDVDQDKLHIKEVDNQSTRGGSVNFNNDNDKFITYQPTDNFNGYDSFEYTISDGREGEATAIVYIRVKAVNDPPKTGEIIPDQTATVGEEFEFTIPEDAFEDVDDDDLRFNFNNLPSWLKHTENRTLRGIPKKENPNLEIEIIKIEVVASDKYEERAISSLKLEVTPRKSDLECGELKYSRNSLKYYLISDLKCRELELYQNSDWPNQDGICKAEKQNSLIGHLQAYQEGSKTRDDLICADQATYYAIVEILDNPNGYNLLEASDVKKLGNKCRELRVINFLWDVYTGNKFSFITQKRIYQNIKSDPPDQGETYLHWAEHLGWYEPWRSDLSLNNIHDKLDFKGGELKPEGLFPMGGMFVNNRSKSFKFIPLTSNKIKAHVDSLKQCQLTQDDWIEPDNN